MPTNLDFNQFASDVKKFREGKLNGNEFVSKYPDFFDEKTDPSKLPKDPDRLAAFFANTVLGAKQSISRDKLASRSLKEILGDDEDYNNLFNPTSYSEEIEEMLDEESGEKTKVNYYLQKPEFIEKLIKNLLLVNSKYFEKRLEEEKSYLLEDLQNRLTELKSETAEEMKTLLQTEAPKVSQEKSLENQFIGHFQKYLYQRVGQSPSLQKFIGQLPTTVDKTKNPNALSVEDFKNQITQKAKDKFKEYLANGHTKLDVNIITSLSNAAISDVSSWHGYFPEEGVTLYDPAWTAKPAEETKEENQPQDNNQQQLNTNPYLQQGNQQQPSANFYQQPQIANNYNQQPQQQIQNQNQQEFNAPTLTLPENNNDVNNNKIATIMDLANTFDII